MEIVLKRAQLSKSEPKSELSKWLRYFAYWSVGAVLLAILLGAAAPYITSIPSLNEGATLALANCYGLGGYCP